MIVETTKSSVFGINAEALSAEVSSVFTQPMGQKGLCSLAEAVKTDFLGVYSLPAAGAVWTTGPPFAAAGLAFDPAVIKMLPIARRQQVERSFFMILPGWKGSAWRAGTAHLRGSHRR